MGQHKQIGVVEQKEKNGCQLQVNIERQRSK